MAKKKSNNAWIWIVGIIVLILIIFFSTGTGKNIVKNTGCETITEYKTETYWDTEYRSNKNCDYDSDCECLHKGGLFNLGACDSCECDVQKTRQVPYTVEKCLWDE